LLASGKFDHFVNILAAKNDLEGRVTVK